MFTDLEIEISESSGFQFRKSGIFLNSIFGDFDFSNLIFRLS